MKQRHILISIILVGTFFLLGAKFLKPVPILPEEELLVAKGLVRNIYETNGKDIFFTVSPKRSFYINRGTERGLKVNLLKAKLMGQTVTFKYPEYKSILGDGTVKHVSVIKLNDETIFSELDQFQSQEN